MKPFSVLLVIAITVACAGHAAGQAAAPARDQTGAILIFADGRPDGAIRDVPAAVRGVVYGKVDDIDRDGKIKIKTDDGSFKLRVSRDAARNLREGDSVTVHVTITPPGPPSR